MGTNGNTSRYQEALEHIACYCSNNHTLLNDFDTLQKAIDELEIYKRALFIESECFVGEYGGTVQGRMNAILKMAREELENGK